MQNVRKHLRRTRVTRQDLSRTLVMYGAFTASGVMLEGDDRRTLTHLRRLRRRLAGDERGEAVARVIRHLQEIVAESRSGEPGGGGCAGA